MKSICITLRDRLLESALVGAVPIELKLHLEQCPDCSAELANLRARRKQLDTLLPLLANAEEPSHELPARILAASQAAAKQRRPAVVLPWAMASAAGIVITGAIGWALHQRTNVNPADVRGAQALAQWRAPTDVLLNTPGREFLEAVPKLGDSYINTSVKTETGGK